MIKETVGKAIGNPQREGEGEGKDKVYEKDFLIFMHIRESVLFTSVSFICS